MSLKLSDSEIFNVLAGIWNDPRYRLAREHSHREGHPAACDYITLAGQALQRENVARGGEWDDIGCNWRRARVGDQSMDGLSVKNPADGRYYFEDVIASAGSPSASIKYHHPFREEALLREVAGGPYAPHGYADPRGLKTHFQYDQSPLPPPTRPAECKFDLTRVEAALQALEKTCSTLAAQVDATKESADAAKAAAEEARDKVHALPADDDPPPPIYVSNRLPVIGTITLRPQ
jgi:hypothetical protein